MAPSKDAKKLRRMTEKKGKSQDQYQLGCLLYHAVEGFTQDKVAAAKWWSKAAAQQHARAQTALAACRRWRRR
jgi:TPR repeat protein